MATDILDQVSEDMESELKVPIISTGNSAIDEKLGGGIPVGSLVLIEGASASGKSVLTQQMIWGSLSTDHRVVLYTTERTLKSHVKQMGSLGLDVLDYVLMGRLKVFDTQRVSNWDAAQALKQVAVNMEVHEAHGLMIIDSLTPMVTPTSVLEIIGFFEQCRRLCSEGKTIVVTLHSYSGDESTIECIRSMCDVNLRLRVDQVGDKLVNVLEAVKVSGATKTTGNVLSFVVEPLIGLRIIPISLAKI